MKKAIFVWPLRMEKPTASPVQSLLLCQSSPLPRVPPRIEVYANHQAGTSVEIMTVFVDILMSLLLPLPLLHGTSPATSGNATFCAQSRTELTQIGQEIDSSHRFFERFASFPYGTLASRKFPAHSTRVGPAALRFHLLFSFPAAQLIPASLAAARRPVTNIVRFNEVAHQCWCKSSVVGPVITTMVDEALANTWLSLEEHERPEPHSENLAGALSPSSREKPPNERISPGDIGD